MSNERIQVECDGCEEYIKTTTDLDIHGFCKNCGEKVMKGIFPGQFKDRSDS